MLPFLYLSIRNARRSSRWLACVLIVTAAVSAQVGTRASRRPAEQRELALPIVISAPTYTRGTPSTFIVPISATDLTGEGVISFQFHLDYDPAVIDPAPGNFGCSTDGTISGNAGAVATCNVDPAGKLKVAVHGPNAMSGSGTLLNLIFSTDALAQPGNVSPLTFDQVGFFNTQGEVASDSTDGQVTLVPVTTGARVSVSGRVADQSGRGITNAVLTVSGGRLVEPIIAITGRRGTYTIPDLEAGETYIITAASGRFTFTQPSRVLTLTDNAIGIDFTANPGF